MSDPNEIEKSHEQWAAKFRRRQRIANVAGLAYALVLATGNSIRESMPVAAMALLMVVTLVLYARAYSCPACGRGIKVDGKTCSGCEKQF